MLNFLSLLRLLFSRKRTATKPAPVSNALDVEISPYHKLLKDALAAIDAVHKDGQLPKIPIKRLALSRGMHGRFQHVVGGRPIEIAVHYASSHAELTVVHEIGHFLDYAGFGNSGEFCSIAGDMLDGWRSAVKNSGAVQRLGQLWRLSSNKVQETQADGNVVEYRVEKQYIEYLLQNEELWARSYAQFITAQSAYPELREQLNHLRDRPARSLYYGEHWDDEDFLPIMAEIEAVFRQLGWMQ